MSKERTLLGAISIRLAKADNFFSVTFELTDVPFVILFALFLPFMFVSVLLRFGLTGSKEKAFFWFLVGRRKSSY